MTTGEPRLKLFGSIIEKLKGDAEVMEAPMDRAARTIAGAVNSQRANITNLAGKGRIKPAEVGAPGSDRKSIFSTVEANDPGWAIEEYGTWNQAPVACTP
jgi:hypothetical protein